MNEPSHRKATTAEALEVLQSRHSDKFSPAEQNELQEAIECLKHLDSPPVPVEPGFLPVMRKLAAKNLSGSEDAILIRYIDTLQSALKRVTEQAQADAVDAERYRIARGHGYGIADWTEHAKPMIRYRESADKVLDRARSAK